MKWYVLPYQNGKSKIGHVKKKNNKAVKWPILITVSVIIWDIQIKP